MPAYRVILVDPKHQGNVGSVARVLMNFDRSDLVLVRPPTLADEAKGRAMHAWDIVEKARSFESFDEAIEGCDFVVGTSARIPADEKSHLRNPIDARDLPGRLSGMSGTVGLVFGREDFGLLNEELELCDLLVTIPTTRRYRSLNLSHAVAVILYEIYAQTRTEPVKVLRPMSEEMKLMFQETMDLLVDQLGLPEHKVRNTKRVYRKVLGRAVPSAWEYFVLMGVLSGTLAKLGVPLGSRSRPADFDLPPDLETEIASLAELGRGVPHPKETQG